MVECDGADGSILKWDMGQNIYINENQQHIQCAVQELHNIGTRARLR